MSSASGHLSSNISYHIILQGSYSGYTFVPQTEIYTETGTTSEDHAETDAATMGGMVNSSDGTSTSNWSLSWSGTITSGMVTLTSYAASSANQWHAHSHMTDPSGVYSDSLTDSGNSKTQSGSGTQVSAIGSSWEHDHQHSHFSGGMPDQDYDNSWNTPFSGTFPVPVTPLSAPLLWKAEDPAATNFSFHGRSELSGSLTETATWGNGRLDVNSYSTTSHDSDMGHVIEDEPAGVLTGTGGTENYHKDQTYTGGLDITGSGSYTSNLVSADYHATETASMAAHNVLTVTGDQATGTDDLGVPYTMTFNYTGDRTTNGSYSNVFDYHDAADGMRVVDSLYAYTGGSTTTTSSSGVRNGQSFSDSSTQTEGGGGSVTFPSSGRPTQSSDVLSQAFPYVSADSGHLLVAYGGPNQPAPGGAFLAGGAVGKFPQAYYNQKIQQIGEDAKKKVGKLAVQDSVMKAMNDAPIRSATGTTTTTSANSLAQAVGQGKILDKAVATAEKSAKARGYTGVTVTPDVLFTYAVEPRPAAGKDRSGKCVVQYQIRVKMTYTTPAGRTQTENAATIGGAVWFIDDNLKTATLQGDP